jgi:hypothetical protein
MALHKNLKLSELHSVQAWQFATATARLAASVTNDDVGKVALQLDNDTIWLLAEAAPSAVWVELTNTTAGGSSGSPSYGSVPTAATGAPQSFLHGLGITPSALLVVPVDLPAGSAWSYTFGTVNSSVITVTGTAGVQYQVLAWGGLPPVSVFRLTAPNASVWDVTVNNAGVLATAPSVGAGAGQVLLAAPDGSRWGLSVDNTGTLNTTLVTPPI